jgi:hypothetical protein
VGSRRGHGRRPCFGDGRRAENAAFVATTDQHFDTWKADRVLHFEQRTLADGLPPVMEGEREQEQPGMVE